MNHYTVFRELEEQLIPLLLKYGTVTAKECKPIIDKMNKVWDTMPERDQAKIYREGPKIDLRS